MVVLCSDNVITTLIQVIAWLSQQVAADNFGCHICPFSHFFRLQKGPLFEILNISNLKSKQKRPLKVRAESV